MELVEDPTTPKWRGDDDDYHNQEEIGGNLPPGGGGTVMMMETEGEENRLPDFGLSSLASISFQNIPCLACGSNCFIKSESEPGGMGTHLEGEVLLGGRELMTVFCQLFKIRSGLRGSKIIGDLGTGWGGSGGGSEEVPFCNECKEQLTLLAGLERKLRELGVAFEKGVRDFREMCEGAEGVFQREGIYGKDKRYFKLRRQFVRVGVGGGPATRRSSSPRRSIRTEGLSALSSYSPVVAVPANEKARADQFQITAKAEIRSDSDNDDHPFYSAFQSDSPTSISFDDDPPEDSSWQPDVKPKTTQGNSSKTKIKKQKRPSVKSSTLSKSKSKAKGSKTKQTKSKVAKKTSSPSTPNNRRKRKLPKPEVDETEESELILGDIIDSDEEDLKRPKRKGVDSDSDFQPDDNAEAQLAEDDNWDDEEGGAQILLNRSTGDYTFLHVTLQPVDDERKKYVCLECQRAIARSTIKRHVFKFHSTRFKCPECDHHSGDRSELDRHIRQTHRHQRYECKTCGRSLYTLQYLRFHQFSHYNEEEKLEAIARGEKPPKAKPKKRGGQCETCGKEFSSNYALRLHTKMVHSTEEEKLGMTELCQLCGTSVLAPRMKDHMKWNHPSSGNPRHTCIQCDKTFRMKAALNRHLKTHRLPGFKCTICGKEFTTNWGFTSHMNLHNNIRPFQCKHCPLAFAAKHTLWKHNRVYHVAGSNPKRPGFLRGLSKADRAKAEASALACEEDDN